MLYSDTLKTTHIVDKLAKPINDSLSEVHREAMESTADTCKYFHAPDRNGSRKSCLYCAYLDGQVYCCGKLNKPVIPYQWV